MRTLTIAAIIAAALLVACGSSDTQPTALQQQDQQQAEPVPTSQTPGSPRSVSLEVDPIGDDQLPAWPETTQSFSLAENADGSRAPIALGSLRPASGSDVIYTVLRPSGFEVDERSAALSYTGRGEDFEATSALTVTVAAAPLGVTGSARLSWRPPASGPSVERYEYRITNEFDSTLEREGETSDTSVQLDDIPIGSDYTAEVRAINDDGASQWAVSSEVRTVRWSETVVTVEITDKPEPPGQVGRPFLSLGDRAHSTIRAGWVAPSNSGSPILDYEYRYRSSGEWQIGATAGLHSAIITGLREGTEYEVQVRAINADGPSEWSNSATIRTVAAPYEPVVRSNRDSLTGGWIIFYHAERDTFTDEVRTDVRIIGREQNLLFDVVCHTAGYWAFGIRMLEYDYQVTDSQPETVTFRVDDGRIFELLGEVAPLGDSPTVYFSILDAGAADLFDAIVNGSSSDARLYARIGFRGSQIDDSFNLRTFRGTPVHQNLVRCGDY